MLTRPGEVARKRWDSLVRYLREDVVVYDLEPYQERLAAINELGSQMARATDDELKEAAAFLRRQVQAGQPGSELLVEQMALVREVAARTVKMRPFNVQVMGGMALYDNRLIEMQTGEGKTLVAVAPAALRAFEGKGTHILTFNDYLAGRDAEWMGPIFHFLGLSVGAVIQGMSREERRQAYAADITYVTAKEAGFDFLRDGLAFDAGELVQRPFHAAIVDEADSILIDEARVPLVIVGATGRASGLAGQLRERLRAMRATVDRLEPGRDYAADNELRNVFLTEAGTDRVEELLQCGSLHTSENLELLTEINLTLHAELLTRRDDDYIVRNGRIELVDDFTGRVIEDRQWPYGLQTAIEVKEGLAASDDARVLGSITLQHFLGQYPHLAGMTATAAPAAKELLKFYELEVVVIPPNRPCIREDRPDVIFTHKAVKLDALVAEIQTVHATGRPVLVGTLTVAESETLAAALTAAGVPCAVLNARHDAEEARIVAMAGELGAVTIATNMAGRGTDIKLGGADGRDYDRVAALGGLYLIGTNRHESRRIDDQLRGRSGRQGDPGSSRFFISFEDDLLVRYGVGELLARRWTTGRQEAPIDDERLTGVIERTQRIIEGQNYDIRQTLWKYSHFVDQQRQMIHAIRRRVLLGEKTLETLAVHDVEKRRLAVEQWGAAAVDDLERRLWLQAVDEAWSDHLETVTEIRDGIHLAEIGGRSPLHEFHKQARPSFEAALAEIEELILGRFAEIEISGAEPDLDELGLRGPSSTWTYLVDDHAITDPLARGLSNMSMLSMYGLTGPLLMAALEVRRWQERKRRRSD